jgi:hypothetical protein
MAKKTIDTAINQLADLFEFGHLDLSTDPVNFIDRVCSEIIRLRKIVNKRAYPSGLKPADGSELFSGGTMDGENSHPGMKRR